MSQDNWEDRKSGAICCHCMWFCFKQPYPANPEGPTLERYLGRCRRHAPSQVIHGWPPVYSTDWCGDFKIDENKQ